MGFAKRLLEEAHFRGWSSPGDKCVCSECFEEPSIQDFIEEHAAELTCSYCGRASAEPIATAIDEVIEYISECIHREWGDVDQECVPYDSSEGGYQIITPVETYDLLVNSEPMCATSAELQDDVVGAFHTMLWCPRDWQTLSPRDRLVMSWGTFVDEVKHRRRYLFSISDDEDEEGEMDEDAIISPSKMLDELGDLIERLGLIAVWPNGTEVFRARTHESSEDLRTASDLGTAPRFAAGQANRMSPAGIPMFYGALDGRTALAETYDPNGPQTATVARFRTTHSFQVVDLTHLPPIPSIYHNDPNRHRRASIGFLYDLVRDLTKPIERDGREHIEYVPTQIVTEYFRYHFTNSDGGNVRGLVYPSTRDRDGVACVLFFENAQCGGDHDKMFGNRCWLQLDPASVTRYALPVRSHGS